MRSTFWTSYGTDGFLVRQTAKRELYPVNPDSASLILMGDWCSKADTVRNENPRSGEENVTEAMEVQKTIFCTIDYYLLLTGWPLMGDPCVFVTHNGRAVQFAEIAVCPMKEKKPLKFPRNIYYPTKHDSWKNFKFGIHKHEQGLLVGSKQ